MKKSKLPPSKRRYQEAHPVVSMRLSRDLYEEAKDQVEITGHSFADIFKLGLDKIQPRTEQALREGYTEAYKDAIREGRIFTAGHCSVCGKPLKRNLNRKVDKQVLEEVIDTSKNVYHIGCKERK